MRKIKGCMNIFNILLTSTWFSMSLWIVLEFHWASIPNTYFEFNVLFSLTFAKCIVEGTHTRKYFRCLYIFNVYAEKRFVMEMWNIYKRFLEGKLVGFITASDGRGREIPLPVQVFHDKLSNYIDVAIVKNEIF